MHAYGILPEEWAGICKEAGLPAFRAKQIVQGLYADFVPGWDSLTTLPHPIRTRFETEFPLTPLREAARSRSADGVQKFLLACEDGESIETVHIPQSSRNDQSLRVTQCISTQVGCNFHCAFCASGQLGCRRSLTAAEIVAQVMTVARAIRAEQPGAPRFLPNNIVVMGMGEPFDNYDNTLRALRILNAQNGLNIGARHITISTCGVVPGILRLAEEGLQFELSVSLHAPCDAIRDRLMPVNRRWPIAELMTACEAYTRKTGRIVTFEYTLVKGVNDSPEHARMLIALLRPYKVRVNLIPLSPVAEFSGETPAQATCLAFLDALLKAGLNTTLRRSRGKQADAACGQLRLRKG